MEEELKKAIWRICKAYATLKGTQRLEYPTFEASCEEGELADSIIQAERLTR